jgi:V/A-type H+/Na+-transporting ATPase subunit I
MFYSQAMTEIELIVPSKDMVEVTKLLSGRGIFHQTDASYLSSEVEGSSTPWQEKAAAYTSLEHRIQIIMQALGMKEGIPPDTQFEKMTEIELAKITISEIEEEVKKTGENLANENKRFELLNSNLNQLESVSDINLDISSLYNQEYLYSTIGTIPVNNIERLQTSLARVPFILIPLRQDNLKAVVWMAGARKNMDIIERAIRSAYFNPLALPDAYKGTPSEIIEALHKNVIECQKTIDDLNAELARLRDVHAKQLQEFYWDLHASRTMADAILRYGRLKYTYLIVGWVISASLGDITQKLKKISKETLIETFPAKRNDEREDIPVSINHGKILRPFQMMVTTYARPLYDELDPTILMALTFPVIYGAMFGDVGQGIILAFLGWLLNSRKVKKLNGLAPLGGLILACGILATIFGFLYGSFFGFEDVIPALWIQPLSNIMLILEIAIGAGVLLMTVSFVAGIINGITSKEWGKVIFERSGIAGLLLYLSILGYAGTALLGIKIIPSFVFLVLAILSGFAIMFSELFKNLVEGHRPLIHESIGTYGIQAFFEIFETMVSLLSNSLSYVRIGAFAVAHGGLSLAIFSIAALFGSTHSIGYILVLIGGNIFIILFEGLIVGIQTMRLEYYESFSKFFTGGGKRFEPLALRPLVDK